jgi:hypothetical protein
MMRLKMGPVLATDDSLDQTTTHFANRQCVEFVGVWAGASNDRQVVIAGEVEQRLA